ncbi:MAG: hypothetical protein KC731_12980 [Myxococcales bacterium]|nr:hypothetical protein [Myxococcales bacterium]
MTAIEPEELPALRAAQLDHLRRFLSGEEARARFVVAVDAAFDELRARPLRELLPLPALSAWVASVGQESFARAVARPVAALLVEELAREIAPRKDTPAGLIGSEGRQAIERLVARPDVLSPALLRKLTADPALEAAMRDVIYDAIVAFNAKTNPFVASWGLPSLVEALPKLGRAPVKKGLEVVRAEFERRLEPEARRFLEGFARTSLDHLVGILIERRAEPEMVALRRHLAATLLAEPFDQLLWPVDDPRHELLVAGVTASVEGVLTSSRARQLVDRFVERLHETYGPQTLDAIAESRGFDLGSVDWAPWLTLLWPTVAAGLRQDATLEALGEVLREAEEAWLATRG